MAYQSMGLWLSGLRLEVEEVSNAHKRPCTMCGKMPQARRVKLSQGSGRSQQQAVLCEVCGQNFSCLLAEEAARVGRYIRGEIACIRLLAEDREDNGWPFDKLRRQSEAKKKLKKAATQQVRPCA